MLKAYRWGARSLRPSARVRARKHCMMQRFKRPWPRRKTWRTNSLRFCDSVRIPCMEWAAMQSICLTSSSSADGTVLSSGLRLLRVNSAAYSLSSLAQSVERTCGRRWQSPFAVDALAMSSAQRLRHRWMLVHQCVCVCVCVCRWSVRRSNATRSPTGITRCV